MISFIRTILTAVVAAVATLFFGTIVVVAAACGVDHRTSPWLPQIPRIWSRCILLAAGVKVRVHGLEHLEDAAGKMSGPFIFACNHVSHFDIPVLTGVLPKHYFVAKSELFKIPVFGPGIRAVGTIPIERNNQKAAFGSYAVAAGRIRDGSSVIVFPEGTRGMAYPIRPFKKGPFVLAVEAGVPVVPCIVHGTLDVLPKKSLRIHPRVVDVHVLASVPSAGLTYDQRNTLADAVHARMADAMESLYHNA